MQIQTAYKSIDFSTPKIMGIINVTPDSFYDGGMYLKEEAVLSKVEEMLVDGVDIIDMGACSTRPGAKEISLEEELKRLLSVFKAVRMKFPETIISIDTYRSEVVRQLALEGVDIINDVSGGTFDEKMFDTVAATKLPYVLMHTKGKPETMQQNPQYGNVVEEVLNYMEEKIKLLRQKQVSQIIIDPGFGFGKNVDHNYALLKNLASFNRFGCPVLVGISRKSMINRVIGTKPEEALNGTTVLNTFSLLNGAKILRVHDVKEARQCIELVGKLA